jgi:drug/metabolite transporter (DMT)-like permease
MKRQPAHPPQQKSYARAALFALTGFTGWTVSDALIKLARTDGVPQGQIFLISGLSGMVVIFLLCALRGKIRRLQPHKWPGLLALGLCQWVAYICWLKAIPHLPLANMYVVAFLTPLTVASLAALILKEQLGWKRAVAIVTGFVGVVIAVNPLALATGTSAAWTPYLAVGGNMLGTATQMLILRVVSQKESSECTSFYPRMVILAAGAVSCAASGFTAMKPWVFLAVCASGALGGFGWALMARAYKNAPAAAVAPFHYSQMITGALLGYLIWGDVPTLWLIGGGAIIIASGIYLVRHERRLSRLMVRAD